MQSVESELGLLREPRLAAVATSTWPAWLWSPDATQIMWTNAAGAALFGAPDLNAIVQRRFDVNNPAAAQVARLAATLPSSGTSRLEQLRGFGTGFGRALTCVCSRMATPDGKSGVLITATEQAGPAWRGGWGELDGRFGGSGNRHALYTFHHGALLVFAAAGRHTVGNAIHRRG